MEDTPGRAAARLFKEFAKREEMQGEVKPLLLKVRPGSRHADLHPDRDLTDSWPMTNDPSPTG